MGPAREGFGSRLGFILAAAGSAVGLGNIWRFPYSVGESGGAAFVLVYLICVILIGVPVMFAEVSMGRASQRNPVGAFRKLSTSNVWPLVGSLGVLSGFAILSFYSVVAGWTLGYLYKAVLRDFSDGVSVAESEAAFAAMIGNPTATVALGGLFILLTVLVVRGGIHGGIERVTKILMPLFVVLLAALCVRSLTLPGAEGGVDFLLAVDFSKINARVVMSALGQALFSLSLGMGAMMTYGSYLPKGASLPFCAASVAFADTAVALLAGFVIFPALFAVGAEPAKGPGLVFVALPTIFDQMPAGNLFAIAFYGLLAVAALTSTISLLEVVVAYLVDERGFRRETAVWSAGGLSFALCVPSALSTGANQFLSGLLGKGFLEINNIVFGNIALSLGALFISLFVGWKWGAAKAIEEIEASGHGLPAKAAFALLVRFLCPLAVVLVLGYLVYTGEFF